MNTRCKDFFSRFVLAIIMLSNLYSCAIHFQNKDFASVVFNLAIALIALLALISLATRKPKTKES